MSCIPDDIREQDEWLKRFLGRYCIEEMIHPETEKFDKRKFKKLTCPYCDHTFNPFYYNTLKQGQWDWVWQGDSHKEPESDCEIPCPKCNEELKFTTYIGQ